MLGEICFRAKKHACLAARECESGCAQNLGKQQMRRAGQCELKGFSGGIHAKLSDVKSSNNKVRRPGGDLWSALFVAACIRFGGLPGSLITQKIDIPSRLNYCGVVIHRDSGVCQAAEAAFAASHALITII